MRDEQQLTHCGVYPTCGRSRNIWEDSTSTVRGLTPRRATSPDPLPGRRHARPRRSPRPRAADTEAAIAAARRAFDEGPWPHTPERERGALLLRLRRPARARREGLRPRRVARHRQAAGRERVRRRRRRRAASATTAASPDTDAGPRGRHRPPTTRSAGSCYEPVGVCGLITPWNYPLLQAVAGRSRRRWPPATRSCSSPAS